MGGTLYCHMCDIARQDTTGFVKTNISNIILI